MICEANRLAAATNPKTNQILKIRGRPSLLQNVHWISAPEAEKTHSSELPRRNGP